jgi:hypothetical protein
VCVLASPLPPPLLFPHRDPGSVGRSLLPFLFICFALFVCSAESYVVYSVESLPFASRPQLVLYCLRRLVRTLRPCLSLAPCLSVSLSLSLCLSLTCIAHLWRLFERRLHLQCHVSRRGRPPPPPPLRSMSLVHFHFPFPPSCMCVSLLNARRAYACSAVRQLSLCNVCGAIAVLLSFGSSRVFLLALTSPRSFLVTLRSFVGLMEVARRANSSSSGLCSCPQSSRYWTSVCPPRIIIIMMFLQLPLLPPPQTTTVRPFPWCLCLRLSLALSFEQNKTKQNVIALRLCSSHSFIRLFIRSLFPLCCR